MSLSATTTVTLKRSESCVEYAEKASLRKHSVWLGILIDIFFREHFGNALLNRSDSTSLMVLTFTNDITNKWWLTSCAILMGNPAGFKVNTKLAGVLGTLSLNAIQIWSTLWGSTGFLFIFFIKGLAISGILFALCHQPLIVYVMICFCFSNSLIILLNSYVKQNSTIFCFLMVTITYKFDHSNLSIVLPSCLFPLLAKRP